MAEYRYGHISILHVYLIRSRIKTTYINYVQYAAPSHNYPFEFVEAFLAASLTITIVESKVRG